MPGLDISTDYTLWDLPQTVQYQSRLSESSYATAVAVADGQSEPWIFEQTTGGSLLPKVTSWWNFGAPAFGSVVPKVGDRFTDPSAISWQVLQVEQLPWNAGWRLYALKMR